MIREFDAFRKYDRKGEGRLVQRGWRGVHERLVASRRDQDYYHGERRFGFGGYRDLGLWRPVARDLIDTYNLSKNSAVLQVGCDFGFLLSALMVECPGIRVAGAEPSRYAISQIPRDLRCHVVHIPGPDLPYGDQTFDLVLCPGLVYTFDLVRCRNLLIEIQRVGNSKRYVNLATYTSAEDLLAFREWTLLGQTLLPKTDWLQLLRDTGYVGDVSFTSAASLGLTLADETKA